MDAEVFLYENAGAPGSIGDAGLWERTSIKQRLDDWLAEITSIKLQAGLEELEVSGCTWKTVWSSDGTWEIGKNAVMLRSFQNDIWYTFAYQIKR